MIAINPDLVVRPIMDREQIESVLFHPAIFDSISEDGSPKQIPYAHYLAGFAGDVCVGILIVNFISKLVADVHIHVLPEYRKAHALEFGINARDWLFNNGLQKLESNVPFCNAAVKNFCKKLGFEVEGVARRRWLKHGKLWDSWHIGCVRGEA